MSDFNRNFEEFDDDESIVERYDGTGDPPHGQSVSVSLHQALELLEKGDIDTEFGILRWSSNYAFLVAVCAGDLKMNAVYKPQKGERPLWDFPDGTLCYRERASFLTSHELGWMIVPPTALREGPRGLGSVQMFVQHDPTINYFSFNDNPGTLKPALMRIAAFDAIINNADRKGGHCLLDPMNHLWGIDHGISFHSAHKLRTVIWDYAGQPIPDALLVDLDRVCCVLDDVTSSYRQEMSKLLSAIEIRAFQNRVRTLLKTRKYPLPGPGPNYPWPPV